MDDDDEVEKALYQEDGPASVLSSVVSLTNTILGAGMLGMARAIQSSGLILGAYVWWERMEKKKGKKKTIANYSHRSYRVCPIAACNSNRLNACVFSSILYRRVHTINV